MNQKLKKALKQYGAVFEERQELIPATIGTDDTFGMVEVPNKTNYVYVRIQSGEIAQAYNTKVVPLAGLRVWCGYEKTRPGLLQVLDVRNVYGKEYQQKVPSHAETHEFGGYDQMFVRGEQFIPKLVSKYSGMTVRIQAGAIYTDDFGWYWHRPQDLDLSPYVPITGAHWALLEVGYSGTINVKLGSTVETKYVLYENTIPAPSNNAQALAAVAMYQSQSGISASKYGGNDILDLRWYQSVKTGTAGGGGGIAEAPLTGLTYGRNSGTWVEVSGTGGGGTTLITGSLSMDLKIDQSSGTTGYGYIKGNQNNSNLFYAVSQDQYMSGRLLVFLNGQALSQGVDWAEQYPSSGTFYFISGSVIPTSTDIITTEYLLTSGSLPTWADAPLDGLQYARQSGSWTVVTGSGAGGIADAPLTGLQYGRQSGSWTIITGSTTVSPATYVFSGTNYNMPASVGTALEYARADHLHGTPPSGTSGISDAPSDGYTYGRKDGAWSIVSGSSGISTDAPADGLQYGRQSGSWTRVTGSGGGVSFSTYKWSGDIYPTSPSLLNDEFDNGSLDAKWTRFDPIGNCTITETGTYNALIMAQASRAGDQIAGTYQVMPTGTNYTVYIKISTITRYANYWNAGFALWSLNSGSTMTTFHFASTSSTMQFSSNKWNNYGSYASNSFSMNIGFHTTSYIRVRKNGTNYYGAYSSDGIGWIENPTAVVPTNEPAYFGIFIDNNGLGVSTKILAHFFRYVPYDVGVDGIMDGGLRGLS